MKINTKIIWTYTIPTYRPWAKYIQFVKIKIKKQFFFFFLFSFSYIFPSICLEIKSCKFTSKPTFHLHLIFLCKNRSNNVSCATIPIFLDSSSLVKAKTLWLGMLQYVLKVPILSLK